MNECQQGFLFYLWWRTHWPLQLRHVFVFRQVPQRHSLYVYFYKQFYNNEPRSLVPRLFPVSFYRHVLTRFFFFFFNNSPPSLYQLTASYCMADKPKSCLQCWFFLVLLITHDVVVAKRENCWINKVDEVDSFSFKRVEWVEGCSLLETFHNKRFLSGEFISVNVSSSWSYALAPCTVRTRRVGRTDAGRRDKSAGRRGEAAARVFLVIVRRCVLALLSLLCI